MNTAEKNNLMDDLAWSIYEYLLEESTLFQDRNLVLLPITVIAKKSILHWKENKDNIVESNTSSKI